MPLCFDLSWHGGTRAVCLLRAAAVLRAGMHRLSSSQWSTAAELPLRGVRDSALLLLEAVL